MVYSAGGFEIAQFRVWVYNFGIYMGSLWGSGLYRVYVGFRVNYRAFGATFSPGCIPS